MPRTTSHPERREQIAEVAWRVIEREGIAKVSLREIAREGGYTTVVASSTEDIDDLADELQALIDGITVNALGHAGPVRPPAASSL